MNIHKYNIVKIVRELSCYLIFSVLGDKDYNIHKI